MKSAKPYIAQHKDRFINELIALLKIPSISADKAYAGDVIATAEVIKSSLKKAGCDQGEKQEYSPSMYLYLKPNLGNLNSNKGFSCSKVAVHAV